MTQYNRTLMYFLLSRIQRYSPGWNYTTWAWRPSNRLLVSTCVFSSLRKLFSLNNTSWAINTSNFNSLHEKAFIHSFSIHSFKHCSKWWGPQLSQSLDFCEKRQMRNKQEIISDGNETMQITETECPDRKALDASSLDWVLGVGSSEEMTFKVRSKWQHGASQANTKRRSLSSRANPKVQNNLECFRNEKKDKCALCI